MEYALSIEPEHINVECLGSLIVRADYSDVMNPSKLHTIYFGCIEKSFKALVRRKVMHVLITGVSGTGKTYLMERLKERGLNAVDVDSGIGIAKFVDSEGKEVQYNKDGGSEWWSNHFYVIDLKVLEKFLKENETAYIFGNSGGQPGKKNGMFDVIDLFDKVYYLTAPKDLIIERINSRSGNQYGKRPEQLQNILTEKEIKDRKAKELGLNFIDATLSTEKIIKIITS